jgi:dTDP-4-dehydrorhamnose reductase
MRVVITGRDGQVARSLAEAGARRGWEIIPLGRPDLDLSRPDSIAAPILAAKPDVVVSAAAWTAVDLAETHEAEAAIVVP